jgi:hypothetical protein
MRRTASATALSACDRIQFAVIQGVTGSGERISSPAAAIGELTGGYCLRRLASEVGEHEVQPGRKN